VKYLAIFEHLIVRSCENPVFVVYGCHCFDYKGTEIV